MGFVHLQDSIDYQWNNRTDRVSPTMLMVVHRRRRRQNYVPEVLPELYIFYDTKLIYYKLATDFAAAPPFLPSGQVIIGQH